MAELQEAGDDVLIPVYRRRKVRELRSFASLTRRVLDMGGPSLKSLPIEMSNTKYVCTAVLLRIQSCEMWRYVSLGFPTFRKERSAFTCTAQAFLERTAFLRCWLFFVDYLTLEDDGTTSKNRKDPETQCNFLEYANRPSYIIPYFPLHRTLKVIKRNV
jgi:hypothetical protein